MLTPDLISRLGSARAVTFRGFAHGLRPPQDIKVSEWSEENIIIPQGVSARSGPWRNDVAPYLVEPMDCLSPSHPCTEVTLKKSSQVGGTQIAINWMGYVAAVVPTEMGYYFPSEILAKRLIAGKINPVIDASATVRRAIKPQTSRDENGSSTFYKLFRKGGGCAFTGVNSSANLQGASQKNIIQDELTEWPFDVDGRGDPDDMTVARTKSYAQRGRKILRLSTTGIKGACRITKAFEDGDQRHYHVPCPECHAMQKLEWGRLQYNRTWPYEAHYACNACGFFIPHHQKTEMLRQGKWIAEKPEAGRQPSFAINQLYSPFISWDDTVAEWLKAEGNPAKEKTFTQQVLGEAYEEKGEVPDAEKLYSRREPYKMRRIPPSALLLTGAADVQGDRIEFGVYAWDRYGTSWLIDKGVLEGDPHQDMVWKRLLEVTLRRYEDCFGRLWTIDWFGVDTGYVSPSVYRFITRHPYGERVKALDGRGGEGRPPLGSPSKVDVDADGKRLGKIRLWPVGTWGMKSELYAALKRTIEGPDGNGVYPAGVAHFPADCDIGFFRQITAEQFRLVERKNGVAVPTWSKIAGQANEHHDIAVYARALFRWVEAGATKEEWEQREKERLAAPETNQRDLSEFWSGASTAKPDEEEILPDDRPQTDAPSNIRIEDVVGDLPELNID